jgi:hypothetical protein
MSRKTKSLRSERRMPKEIPCYTSIYLNDFRQAIRDGLTRRELLKLIILIDEDVADWDFTMSLHKHFTAEAKKYEKEFGGES